MDVIAQEFKQELEMEAPATRKCIERLREDLFDYKPHDKSMKLSGLAVMMAEMPKWVVHTIAPGVIDFQTWERYNLTTVKDLLDYFDKNLEAAKETLAKVSDEQLEEMFYLKMGDKELAKESKRASISGTLNHWVHHRGQLTVYMRLNNIPVPKIYGPSADEPNF